VLRLLALSLLLAALPALPAPAKRGALSQVLKGEALERYEAARLEFKASRFQQALTFFTQAHELAGDPRLLWNAAACLRKLERNAEALRIIDRYLVAASELSPEELDEARRAQVAVRALVAIVRITTSPADVASSLDGTPLEALVAYVEPGRHAFHFSKPGYTEQLRQEGLKAGETVTWNIELAPIVVAVTPVAPPPDVKVITQPPPVPVRWAPWVVVGSGGVAAVVGTIFLVSAGADFTRLRQQCGTVCPPQLWAGSRDREIAGVVLLSAGAAAIAAGIGWWALGGEPRVRVSLGPGQLSLEVRF
jgi:hypothetical protein